MPRAVWMGLLACAAMAPRLEAADQDAWYRYEQQRRDRQENRDLTYWRERRALVNSSVLDFWRPMPTMMPARIPDPWGSQVVTEFRSEVEIWDRHAPFVTAASGSTPSRDLARRRYTGEVRYVQNLGYRWLTLETRVRGDHVSIADDADDAVTAMARPELSLVFPWMRQRYHNSQVSLGVAGWFAGDDVFRVDENIPEGSGIGFVGRWRHSYRVGRWSILLNSAVGYHPWGEGVIDPPNGDVIDYEYERLDARMAIGTSYRWHQRVRIGAQGSFDLRQWTDQTLDGVAADQDRTTQWMAPIRVFAEIVPAAGQSVQGSIGMYPFNDFEETDEGAKNLTWTASYAVVF